jgi:hypothetical protein
LAGDGFKTFLHSQTSFNLSCRRISFRLHQPWTFVGRWILGTSSGAAVIPDTYGLQAGDAHNTTSFDNHTMFHRASLERPPWCSNALFGLRTTFISDRKKRERQKWAFSKEWTGQATSAALFSDSELSKLAEQLAF